MVRFFWGSLLDQQRCTINSMSDIDMQGGLTTMMYKLQVCHTKESLVAGQESKLILQHFRLNSKIYIFWVATASKSILFNWLQIDREINKKGFFIIQEKKLNKYVGRSLHTSLGLCFIKYSNEMLIVFDILNIKFWEEVK